MKLEDEGEAWKDAGGIGVEVGRESSREKPQKDSGITKSRNRPDPRERISISSNKNPKVPRGKVKDEVSGA